MSTEIEDEKKEVNTEEEEEQPFLQKDDKTVGATKKSKKKGMLKNILYGVLAISILIIVTVVTTILIIVYTRENQNRVLFSFDDMFDSKYKPVLLSPKWSRKSMQSSVFTYFESLSKDNDTCDLKVFDPETSNLATLISHVELKKRNITCSTRYEVSYGLSYVFFQTETKQRYRHSFFGHYIAYDISKKKYVDIMTAGSKQLDLNSCPVNASLLSYVQDNDIYVQHGVLTSATHRVTNDGDETLIFNGVADWLYEEDVLGDFRTTFFSSSCSNLAYIRLNDTQVHDFVLPSYSADACYPAYTNIKYPVAGGANPVVEVFVYNIKKKQSYKINLGSDRDIYVYDIKWKTDNEVVVVIYDRKQQKKSLLLADLTNPSGPVVSTTLLKEFTTSTWFQYRRNLLFFDDGKKFADITLKNGEDRFGISIFDSSSTATPLSVISGKFDITSIYGVFEGNVFFQGINSFDSNLYVYNDTTKESEKFSKFEGCDSASIDPFNSQFVVLSNLGPGLPYQNIYDNRKTLLRKLSNNDDVAIAQSGVVWPHTDVSTIQLGDYEMDYMITFPPYFVTSEIYPILIHLYGGPGSKLVSNSYNSINIPFHTYMASQGFIIATLDGRGTSGKGDAFMKEVFLKLGQKETEDQVLFKKYLQSLYYVDASKMSIWGWSYGGFESLMTSISSNDFSVAISIAPVTDQRYYDSAYSERYMGFPKDNKNYVNTSVIEKINDDSLKNTHFLLCHGLFDDNVHPLNSMNLITELQERGIQFDLMMFPNKSHSLLGKNTQKFLYKKLSDTLLSKGK